MLADLPVPGPWSPPDAFDDLTVIRLIGTGGMGSVYRALDRTTGELVAVKFLTPRTPDRSARPRFEREIWALQQVRHPNVLAIHRRGVVHDRPYLVSELIAGPRLDEVARPAPWAAALYVGQGAARALAAIHAAGVIHRDLKPSNLMLTATREVKLIDFGLARLARDAADPAGAAADPGCDVTQVGHIVGTPRYLSPEVWTGDTATVASDIHALGMVLYELLVGRLPFARLEGNAIAHAMRDHDLPPVGSRVQWVPEALTTLVDRMVARDPAARPASAADVVAVLDELDAAHPGLVELASTVALRRRGRAARQPATGSMTLSRVLAQAS